MNKEQIIDEAYKNYWDTYPNAEKTFQYEGSSFETRRMTKDEFIDKCKKDPEFSEKWGLKIEERELSLEERITISTGTIITGKIVDENVIDAWELHCKKDNIPTKLITITFNNETIGKL